MEIAKDSIMRYLEGKCNFKIPVYQRKYSWKKENCKRLFQDIEELATKDDESKHFMGTVVWTTKIIESQYSQYLLIDGQQRITSINLLLKALQDAINDESIKEGILEEYLINIRAPEALKLKFQPIEQDRELYQSIINGSVSQSKSFLFSNYQLFKTLIKDSKIKPKELYNALFKLEVISIQLGTEDPQAIFESLNSTGLALEQSDLIRNFLLMNLDENDQKKLYQTYWLKIEETVGITALPEFIRDYLIMKNMAQGNIKKDNVYFIFKKNFNDQAMTTEKSLKDLLIYAEYYQWFYSPELCEDDKIKSGLQHLKEIKSTTVYPPLLYFFKLCFTDKQITVDELDKMLKLILSYLIRRAICNCPTNSLNKVFPDLIKAMNNEQASSLYDKLVTVLMNKNMLYRFPRNDEFETNFMSSPIYNKKNINKLLLLAIAEYDNPKEPSTKTDDISIEHIMPQNLTLEWKKYLGDQHKEIHDQYLHTIGNLTLTGYNPELSNKPFEAKKKMYRESSYSITRSIANYERWSEESIKARATEILHKAKEIWVVPENYIVKDNIEDNSYDLMDDDIDPAEFKNTKPLTLTISNERFDIESWRDLLIKLAEYYYEMDSNLFKRLPFINKKNKSATPYKIDEEISIDVHGSAANVLGKCRQFAELYPIEEDEIIFTVNPQPK